MNEAMLDLEVTGLAHDGRAVGRVDGRVVFARGGLPGQKVQVRITKDKKTFAEGECVGVLTEAPDAVPAHCAHADVCGGCPLQQMPLAQQHHWKERMLVEALSRIGKVAEPPVEALRTSPKSWGYRNKVEFAFGATMTGSLLLGLRTGGTHEVFDATHCALVSESGLAVLAALRAEARSSKQPVWDADTDKGFWRFAVLRMPALARKDGSPQVVLTVITAKGNAEQHTKMQEMGRRIMELCPQVTSFVHEERYAPSQVAQGEKTVSTLGDSLLYEHLGGVNFTLYHGSFFQINTEAAEHLCAIATEMADLQGQEVVWDLYCGVGAPGLCLASKAKALYGVECVASAAKMATRNAKALGFGHCRYEAGDVRNLLPRLREMARPDVVLLDPPRAGLNEDVVRAIAKARPQRIIYISCNPATLARDAALLAPAYSLARVVPVDLFPHTAHVESVSLFLPSTV